MTLLIIGAGGHGHVCAEVAQACGYDKIDFLDDNPGEGVVGSIEGLELWLDQYDEYFVGIGSNEFRRHLIGRLEKNGVKVVSASNRTYQSEGNVFENKKKKVDGMIAIRTVEGTNEEVSIRKIDGADKVNAITDKFFLNWL